MADKEDEKARADEANEPEVVVLPPKGQRTGQTPKPVMPIGASGPAPAELNPGSSSTASVAQPPDTEEKP
jgi:hypothetical protein